MKGGKKKIHGEVGWVSSILPLTYLYNYTAQEETSSARDGKGANTHMYTNKPTQSYLRHKQAHSQMHTGTHNTWIIQMKLRRE